ncbi:hypothetical protein BDN72DRAFT_906135 [Pluteus cervinus]|uniref:Uncharacterized protein n=1 Tax=Pluteus cervinus TaxID=181527 RepID=A0ACD3A0B4_9AGAR|nr:hypothetical protein BDN72DRAFT_906135 [Pluteus cervinus]
MPSFLRNLMHIQQPEEWNNAIRSLFCFGAHRDGTHRTGLNRGSLHPLYKDVRSGIQAPSQDKIDLDHFFEQLMRDICDKAVTLDRCDGGITVVLRIPGQLVMQDTQPESITVDACLPPREVAVAGEEFTIAITSLIQTFGEKVGLPYLLRFQERCAMQGDVPPPAPAQGTPLKPFSSPFPSPEQPGSAYYRLGLLQAGVFAQETALYRQAKKLTIPLATDLEDEEIEEIARAVDPGPSFWEAAAEYATQFDDVQVKKPSSLRVGPKLGEYAKALIIGPCTVSVLESCALDVGLIPLFCQLVRKHPSEEWEARLRRPEFGLSPKQASLVAAALVQDTHKKMKLSRKCLVFIFIVGVIIGVALLYNFLAFA